MLIIQRLQQLFLTVPAFGHVAAYFYRRSFGSYRPLQIYFGCNQVVSACHVCAMGQGDLGRIVFCMSASSQMTSFCKSEDCPSSNELLEFQNSDLPRTRAGEIRRHLTSCEFCSAEVEFYS